MESLMYFGLTLVCAATIVAVILLPFYMIAMRIYKRSQKDMENEIDRVLRDNDAITITPDEMIVTNATKHHWKSYSVYIFTEYIITSLSARHTAYTYEEDGAIIFADFPAGETKRFPLDNFYKTLRRLQYSRAYKIEGAGVSFTINDTEIVNQEFEYYQLKNPPLQNDDL